MTTKEISAAWARQLLHDLKAPLGALQVVVPTLTPGQPVDAEGIELLQMAVKRIAQRIESASQDLRSE